MGKKPRIAFCFSGQARTLEQTYLFFKTNLFDASKEQGFDYDVFCAVEDDEDVDKVNLLNPTKVEKIKSSEVEKIIEKKRGKNWENDFKNKYPFQGRPNVLWLYFQQIYKVSRSIIMKNEYETNNKINYEIVFKLRFDCYFLNKLNFANLSESLKKNFIIANETETHILPKRFRIINDFFFIGNNKNMSLLGNIFDDVNLGFSGFERKNFKFLSKTCTVVKNYIYKHTKPIGKRHVTPVLIRWFESFFYKICSPELHYFTYFKENGVTVKTEKFSYILHAKNPKSSYIRLEDKNSFEL